MNEDNRVTNEAALGAYNFVYGAMHMVRQIHALAKTKGWHDAPQEDGTAIALIHSELSEMIEALRKGNPPSEKIPEFTQEEEEAADVLIRLFDYSGKKELRIADAVIAKYKYNQTRPYKHGNKIF